MPLFQYEGLSEKGETLAGIIEAENIAEAKQKLIKASVFLQKIGFLKHVSKPLLPKNELLHFTRELSRLLKAGLPLHEALSAMEEKYRGQKAQKLLLDLCEQVKGGQSFSKALGRHAKTFDLLYVAMIENAEKTGRLAETLEELSLLLAKEIQVRKQLVSSLLYPTLLLCFCFFVLGILFFYVVPSIEELFEGRSLHPFTEIVFYMSRAVRKSKQFFLLFSLILICSLGIARTSLRWNQLFMKKALQAPMLRKTFAKVALIRFCRSAAALLEGGVPIVIAFSQARITMRHPFLEQIVEAAEVAISQGAPIHSPFQHHPLIPPLVPRMLGMAQEGGNLPGMLRQIAEIYEEELERSLAYFSNLAQPVLLLFLGAIVGFVLLSVLIPLTDVTSFAI